MSRFKGTAALLLGRARPIRGLAVVAAFSGGAAGVLARLANAFPGDHERIVFGALCLIITLAVFVGGGGLGVHAPVGGGRSRREELLCLPIGRLALPTAQLLGALAAVAAAGAAFLIAFAAFGRATIAPTLLATQTGDGTDLPPEVRGAIFGGIFLLLSLLQGVGFGPGAVVAISAGVPALLCAFAGGAGYEAKTAILWAKLFAVPFVPLYLVLPFVLHAGPAHRFAPPNGDHQKDDNFISTLLVVVVVLGLFGVGKALAVVVVLSVIRHVKVVRASPPVPARRASGPRLAFLLLSAALLPPFVLGLAVDQKNHFARLKGKVLRFEPSPDGKHAVVERLSPYGERTCVSVVRVGDPASERSIPVRLAQFTPACWSRDGRWLAIQDQSFGRLALASSSDLKGLPLENFAQAWFVRRFETLVLDVESGELRRFENRLLGRGWTTPEELIGLDVSVEQVTTVDDSRGHVWTVPEHACVYRLVGYGARGPVLHTQSGYMRFGEGVARLGTSSGVLDPRWTYEVTKPSAKLRATDEDDALPVGGQLVLTASWGEKRTFAVALEPGWEVVVPATHAWTYQPAAQLVLSNVRDLRAQALDLQTGERRPLASGPELIARRLAGGRVFGTERNTERPVFREGDGPVRPLVE